MFYDLNVPWAPNDRDLERTIAFLDELGYNVIALTHTLTGKLPSNLACPIPEKLPFPVPPRMRILRRCTIVLDEINRSQQLAQMAKRYDIVAIRPTDGKLLEAACLHLDCDIISIDVSQRFPTHFRYKTLAAAIARGIRFELCYGPSILARDSAARKNVISNASQLIRTARGRGIIVSSEADKVVGIRGPWDAINLAAIWGLSQERGVEAVGREAQFVVEAARLRRQSYRGVVDVVHGGEKTPQQQQQAQATNKQQEKNEKRQPKRKAEKDEPVAKRLKQVDEELEELQLQKEVDHMDVDTPGGPP